MARSQTPAVDPITGTPLGAPPIYGRAGEYDSTYGYWDDKRGPGPRVMTADTLEGDTVRNDAGDKLGELVHIMLDVPTGRVAYGVLSVGGFLGIGDKLFAIPWKALRLDTENHGFRLNVSKERLEAAEGFDKDAWPTMADQQWAERVHAYYETEPYWR